MLPGNGWLASRGEGIVQSLVPRVCVACYCGANAVLDVFLAQLRISALFACSGCVRQLQPAC